MKRAFYTFLLIALGGILSLGLSGCVGTFTGTGWINSIVEGENATFGFNVQVVDEEGNAKGQFQYSDHGTGYQFHGEILYGIIWVDRLGSFAGITDDGLHFTAQVFDGGEPGSADPGVDLLAIRVTDDDGLSVYENLQPLGGGNIQRHPAND